MRRGLFNVHFRGPNVRWPSFVGPNGNCFHYNPTNEDLYNIERCCYDVRLNRAYTSYLHHCSYEMYMNYGFNDFSGYTSTGGVSGTRPEQTRYTQTPLAITLKSNGVDQLTVSDPTVRVLTNLKVDNKTVTNSLTSENDTTTKTLSVTTFTRTYTLSVHDGTSTRFLNVSSYTNTNTLSVKDLTTTNFLSALSGTYSNYLNVNHHTNTRSLSVKDLATTNFLSALSGTYSNFLDVNFHTNTNTLSVKDLIDTSVLDIKNQITIGSNTLGNPINYLYKDSTGFIEVDGKVYYSAEVVNHMVDWLSTLGDKIYDWYQLGGSNQHYDLRHTMSYPLSDNVAYQEQSQGL